MDGTVLAKLVGVSAYLVIMIVIGVVASRRMKNIRDYFAAGKQLGFWSVAFSARATGESAWLLLGLTGLGAAVGVQAFWVVAGEVLGVAAAWLFMARRFNRLTTSYDSITIPDFLEARFRDADKQTIRKVAAGALVVFVTIYVSAQIDATGKAFDSFLGWNYYVGALVGFAVVLAYITTGGFLAVVWSDVFQGALMFLGLVLLPIVGVISAGGPLPVLAGLAAQDPALLSWTGGAGLTPVSIATILGLLLIGLGFLGSPQIFARFLALRDPGEVRKGAAVALGWTLLAEIGAVVIGLVGRHLLNQPGEGLEAVFGHGAENVLPMLVEDQMPAILVGLYIAIVLSAIMSTVDSLLVVASSALLRDVYQKVLHPELTDEALIQKSRIATVFLAFVALSVAMTVAVTTPDRKIFWFVIFGWSGIAATFCPTMILALFWPKMTRNGALAAMISGFFSVPFFTFVAPKLPEIGPIFGALAELPPSFAVSAAVGVVVSTLDSAGQAAMHGVEDELKVASESDT